MNSKFTDIFIRRPVLAIVISLIIFFMGLRSAFDLQVRQFPKMENAVITVTTAYPGAPADLIQGFITTPLEKEINGAEGIDYMTSESSDGMSSIHIHIKLNFDPNVAFTNIMSKVAEVRGELPKASEPPVIQKDTGSSTALMYISFSSDEMNGEQITDYITRVVIPKLETVSGVAEAKILGGQSFAMRIWLNPKQMAAFGVSLIDVGQALKSDSFLSAAGKVENNYVAVSVNAKTDLQTKEQFEDVIIKQKDHTIVRLRDIAKVTLGAESYNSSVYFNGKKAVFVAINAAPTANSLTVATDVRAVMPSIMESFPASLESKIVHDGTDYIRSSIKEVAKTILEAGLIVIIVIFLFLGSMRTVFIPVVTIPLSLIGVCTFMLMLGYSLNLLTLLAMVLAIGMVVDDAIVVVENVYRHIEEGMNPFDATLKGAREIATPVIAMTITLAAVYSPIGFMSGLTGALFKEFAFTLASAVIISGIIALTLSPMMCSKVLNAEIGKNKFVHAIDVLFNKLKVIYENSLSGILEFKIVTIVFAFFVLLSCIFLYKGSKSELAPQEDSGFIFAFVTGPQSATLSYMEKFTSEYDKIYKDLPAIKDHFTVNGFSGVNTVITGVILKPWDERSVSADSIKNQLQQRLDRVAGLQAYALMPPPLPTSGGDHPINFILTTTDPYLKIYPLSEELLQKAQGSGLFMFINNTLKFNKPQIKVAIDRNRAALLGVSMQDIGDALSVSLGENYLNRYNMEGKSYKVIPQLEKSFRLSEDAIKDIHVKTSNGSMVPLSNFVTITNTIQPNSLGHFQQLNSIALQGAVMPGHTIKEGLDFLKAEAAKIMPKTVSYNYAGQSRQFMQESHTLMVTFIFAIIIIFLVLAAQFESFRDPLIVMISVPMAICGALLPINWGLATINIYTQIGLVTLVGLISKHGILMVEFANQLKESENLSAGEAMQKAAAIRLRPILMTTAAMVLGVIPLLLSTGAGANSRFSIGLVISAGMAIGTLFTLYVLPVIYTLKTKQILLFLLSVGVVGAGLYQVLM